MCRSGTKTSAVKGPVYPVVSPVCLDQGRGRETAPSASFGGGRGTRFHPPSGGASRAFGLPQAAAKRIFAGRSPHPLAQPIGPNDRRKTMIPELAPSR